MDENKLKIVRLFFDNIYNKNIETDDYNVKHDGKEGHWLEMQLGLSPNGRNEPDIYGYEMKKDSKKITFGDYSATEYLFSKTKTTLNKLNQWDLNQCLLTRENFIQYFGNFNEKKQRYSWSGSCFPKYGQYNNNGQIIKIIQDTNDIVISYKFSEDCRERKHEFPQYLKNSEIVIAFWNGIMLKKKIENKFNINGFFICEKKHDKYNSISFGSPFDFTYFIECFKKKIIIIDSGMMQGNTRNYSQFRSERKFWNYLITEKYTLEDELRIVKKNQAKSNNNQSLIIDDEVKIKSILETTALKPKIKTKSTLQTIPKPNLKIKTKSILQTIQKLNLKHNLNK